MEVPVILAVVPVGLALAAKEPLLAVAEVAVPPSLPTKRVHAHFKGPAVAPQTDPPPEATPLQGKTPVVVAVSVTGDGKPDQIILRVLRLSTAP
jgi:hypothetical protein